MPSVSHYIKPIGFVCFLQYIGVFRVKILYARCILQNRGVIGGLRNKKVGDSQQQAEGNNQQQVRPPGGRGLALHHRRESLLDAAGFLMVKTPLLNALAKLAAHVLRASKCQIEIFCGFIYCLRQFLTKLFFKEWEH